MPPHIQLWDTKLTPKWLKWSWLCSKPKNPAKEVTLEAPGSSSWKSSVSFGLALPSAAHALDELQRKADIISAFTTLFDMEISLGKLRLAVFGAPPPLADRATADTLLIHSAGWAPQPVPLRRSGTIKMFESSSTS